MSPEKIFLGRMCNKSTFVPRKMPTIDDFGKGCVLAPISEQPHRDEVSEHAPDINPLLERLFRQEEEVTLGFV